MRPNFLVVGAARSATTSLYRHLQEHPDVLLSPKKEPHFLAFIGKTPNFQGPHDAALNREIVTRATDYDALFAAWNGERSVGECSASYLFFAETAPAIRRELGSECRIIAILRDPVERAFSHWTQLVMIGHETASFEEALAREEERAAQGWSWHYQLRRQGHYAEQLEPYLELFGRDHVRVYLFEDLVREPRATLSDLFDFLGVDAHRVTQLGRRYNSSGGLRSRPLGRWLERPGRLKAAARSFAPAAFRARVYAAVSVLNTGRKPALAAPTREQLRGYYHDRNDALAKLLGRELECWQGMGGCAP